MKKNFLVTVLAFILIVGTMTSCGIKSTGGLNKQLNLTVWNTQGTDYAYKDMSEDIPGKWLKERTGVSVKNIYGNDGGQWDSKLTKLVVGNNLPDIIWCQAGQGSSHFSKMEEMNKVWLLTDEMLQKYAPNIWKRTPSYIWDLFRDSDGNITGIPYSLTEDDIDTVYSNYTDEEKDKILSKVTHPTSVINQIAVRDDILKKIFPEAKSYDELVALLKERNEPIGDELMDIPILTTQEYIDFMYKIKDLNLIEDGKKVYTYGYSGSDNWEAFVYLGGAMYGTGWHQYTAAWNDVEEKIEVPLTKEIVKKMARTQNQMISDNVIDPESIIHTTAQFQAKLLNGQFALCWLSSAGTYAQINSQLEESGKQFKYRPFYVKVPAIEGYDPYKTSAHFNSAFCILNTLSEEEMIQVLKWADLQYTDEFKDIYYWGAPEDNLYTKNADGTRTYVDDKFNQYFLKGEISSLDAKDSRGLGNLANRFLLTPMPYTKYTPKIYNNVIDYTPETTSGFSFKADSEYSKCVKEFPPCEAYASEFGNIPEVVAYWAAREKWESEISKALATTPDQFDTKWQNMLDVVGSIVDVKTMEEKMTEVAKPYADKIKSRKTAQ